MSLHSNASLFLPFSSDDGFSVADFFTIDPKLGEWDDVSAIGDDFQLMFDYVVNHFSSKSQWFENYLAGCEGFEKFAIAVDPSTDLSMVTRPRSLPLLTKYRKKDGKSVHLWTTFSYELNITYLDAILAGEKDFPAQKFLASQAIQYALPGVPATYIHSLLGSRNWLEGVRMTGRSRSVNREKLNLEELILRLNDPESLRTNIFFAYCELIKIRRGQPAFHPNAGFEILDAGSKVFAVKRSCKEQEIVALTNIVRQPQRVNLKGLGSGSAVRDLITGETMAHGPFELGAYQYMWLSKPLS